MATTEQVVDVPTPEGPMAAPTYLPDTDDARPAVIVIMEAFGVNPNITGIAQRFAEEGYVAVAPDLFHRGGRLRYAPYDQLQQMRESLRVGFSDQSIDSDVAATIEHLRMNRRVTGAIGIVGFCLGGRISLQSAIRTAGLSAAAIFYGGFMFPDSPGGFHALREASALQIPVAGFFGQEDQNPTPEQARSLDNELLRLGKEHEFHYYAGSGHGFFCDDRSSHNPDAAADAWERTLGFFASHLAKA